ncbi:MAG: hypothetical protein LBB08_02030 [Rickettsiales bacterium]|jgi:hypothetical protein|nr:hypothetical protein [Rickettsiales bacterium]
MAQAKKTMKKTAPKKSAEPSVKKAAAKTAPASVKKTAAPAVSAVPAAAKEECHCSHRRICWKKVLIFLLGVVIGVAAGKLTCHGGKKPKKFGHHPEFVEGCLDLSKVKHEEMRAKLESKDADSNGCITKEELTAAHVAPLDPPLERKEPRKPRRNRGARMAPAAQ